MEFSDRTVDRAVDAACAHFKTEKENLEIDVITKGSTGLFGIGGRPAKIVARPKGAEQGQTDSSVEPSAVETLMHTEEEEDKAVQETETSSKIEETRHNSEQDKIENAEHAMQDSASDDDLHNTDEETEPQSTLKPKADPEEIAAFCEKARHITSEIITLAGLEGNVDVKQGKRGPYLDISGEDLPIIIGKEGNTLNAIEFLVNLLTKRIDQTMYRVMIEAQGYREKKEQGLRFFAAKSAEKVQKTGKPFSMQPMTSRERRIVHIALKNNRDVKTLSSGEGRFRKVVIVPRRRRGMGRNPKRNMNYQHYWTNPRKK